MHGSHESRMLASSDDVAVFQSNMPVIGTNLASPIIDHHRSIVADHVLALTGLLHTLDVIVT
jgi:hypothetical protein